METTAFFTSSTLYMILSYILTGSDIFFFSGIFLSNLCLDPSQINC